MFGEHWRYTFVLQRDICGRPNGIVFRPTSLSAAVLDMKQYALLMGRVICSSHVDTCSDWEWRPRLQLMDAKNTQLLLKDKGVQIA